MTNVPWICFNHYEIFSYDAHINEDVEQNIILVMI